MYSATDVSTETGVRLADQGSADIGWLLAESRRLLDHAIAEHHDARENDGNVIRLRPGEGWQCNLHQLLQRGHQEALLAVASPLRIQPHYREGRRLVADMLSTGKEVRLLFSQRYATTRDHESLREQPELRDQIRVSEANFDNMIIIDRQIAAVWGDTDQEHPYGFVVNDTDLLRVLHQFATVLWESAPGLPAHLTLRRSELDSITLAVLGALDLGLTDELAARRLAVSVRTYRRHVADIMARLGVATRFQIGARAMELGLLKAPAEDSLRTVTSVAN